VVNLIFDKPVYNKGYDTWCPGNRFTDFIVADWTIRNQAGYHLKYNILTFYTPLREAERPKLLSEEGARAVAASVLKDFQKLYSGSKVDSVEVQTYRRGHPLYMSTPSLYTQVQPLVRQPLGCIFFANTDSFRNQWSHPRLQTHRSPRRMNHGSPIISFELIGGPLQQLVIRSLVSHDGNRRGSRPSPLL
jgi:hypothetical protein